MPKPSAVTVAAALLLSSATAARAQTSPASAANTWELRFTSGGLVPTGSQRSAIDDAQVSGAQLAWLVRPSLAITGSFAWARSRDVATSGVPKLDIFTSDIGVEARPVHLRKDGKVTFTPFLGLGAGARSYNYRKLDQDATHNLAAYGSMGGELGIRRVAIRLEARDYLTGFRPLAGAGKSATRNDVVIMGALSLRRGK